MKLIVTLDGKEIELALEGASGIIDKWSAFYYYDLDTRLIEGIDMVMKRNGIEMRSILDFSLVSPLGSESTGHKIAEAFIEGLRTVTNG